MIAAESDPCRVEVEERANDPFDRWGYLDDDDETENTDDES